MLNQKVIKMKKLIFTFFAVLMLFGAINAQIVITNSSMPAPGDIIRNSIFSGLDSLYGANYTTTGADYTWNFSHLGWFKQKIDTIVNVDETPYASAYTGICNVAYNITKDDLPIPPGLPISVNLKEGFAYMNSTTGEFTQVGLSGKINVPMISASYYPTNSVFDSVDVVYKFPLTYGNRDSSRSFNLFTLNAGIYNAMIYEHKKRVNFVDGWGNITTPKGTFPCLRLKSICTIHDSMSVPGFIDTAINRSTNEYIWLTTTLHEPVLKVTESSANGSTTYRVQYMDNDRYLGISENELVTNMAVYPNPAKDIVNIDFSLVQKGGLNVELYDIIGNKVSVIYSGDMAQGTHQLKFNASGFDKGLYFIRLTSDNNKPVTRRLMVN